MSFVEKRKLKNDTILGIGLLFAALCLWFVMALISKQNTDSTAYVRITINNQEFAKYPLDSNERININDTNFVIISDGYVWMEEANCKDKLCINQGKISLSGQTIICLPNKVMVTIVGKDNEIDAIAK